MSHFAKVVDGIVQEVIVAEQDFIDTLEDKDLWIQTSYNTREGKHYSDSTHTEDSKPPLRKNYAGKGYSYDRTRDAFIPPKPYESWVLNEETCVWDAPTPRPDTPKKWVWDEETTTWKEFVK